MSDQLNKRIELLPKGEFSIKDAGGQQLRGRFSMYALNRFCKSAKVESYLALFQKLVFQMTLEEYAELVMIGLQDFHRGQPNTAPITSIEAIMDLIDDLGGVSSQEFNDLIRHAIDRVGLVKPSEDAKSEQPTPEELEAKKKERNANIASNPSSSESSNPA